MLKIARHIAIIALAGSGFLATTAIAQVATAQPEKKAYDPNERICENITLTGSRLATRRFCGTRAQWEERRRMDREAVEAAQRSPCVVSTTGASGRPSC